MASTSPSRPVVNFENQTLIPPLPNDIAGDILARLSRSHHPTLSLVSKAFHSFLSSPYFFTIRYLIDTTTETSVFVTLCSDDNPFTYHFYTLHLGRLVNLPPVPCCAADATYATLGRCIYVLAGAPSKDVWIFNCRSNKWARGPSMHVARTYPTVRALNGKLYVKGGCRRRDETSMEAYDPVSNTWEKVDDLKMDKWEAIESLRVDEAYDAYVEECVDVIRRHRQYVANSLKKVVNVEGKSVVFWEQKGNDEEGLKEWEVRWMEIDVRDRSKDLKGKFLSPCRCRIINCSVAAF